MSRGYCIGRGWWRTYSTSGGQTPSASLTTNLRQDSWRPRNYPESRRSVADGAVLLVLTRTEYNRSGVVIQFGVRCVCGNRQTQEFIMLDFRGYTFPIMEDMTRVLSIRQRTKPAAERCATSTSIITSFARPSRSEYQHTDILTKAWDTRISELHVKALLNLK